MFSSNQSMLRGYSERANWAAKLCLEEITTASISQVNRRQPWVA